MDQYEAQQREVIASFFQTHGVLLDDQWTPDVLRKLVVQVLDMIESAQAPSPLSAGAGDTLLPRLEAELAAKRMRVTGLRADLLSLQTAERVGAAAAEPKALDQEAAARREALALLRELNRLIESDTSGGAAAR